MKKMMLLCLTVLLLTTGCQKTQESSDSQGLTLEKVAELSEAGKTLSWDDFQQFTYQEMGSGLYIRQYDLEKEYSLLIGGKSVQKEPDYIYLMDASGQRVDIRSEDVGKFIEVNE
ncbi:hypothetical protein [Paenibacillus lemnae]|uniref:Lipoprotein n=1 Tax=Paenibacillus lemnae TaxID=1330551 RepID=A0A848MCW6_PAELE|nr:hypothetical protein [Paenibacillus lemnae]NMO97872.1 hypothetical protein [Paenibacillus lemnae]